MNQEKVTIITVCYNCQDTIATTIESVLTQTYDNIEYIIIDGLSTDETIIKASAFKSRMADRGFTFKIVSEKDEGIYDAMNKGITMAHGLLIGLINSGDWYEPEAVEKMVRTYRNTRFDMFYADLRIWKKSGIMIKRAKIRTYATTRDWNHPTTFIQREIYEKFLYRCEGVYDDWDLVLRIKNAGYKIVVLNETLANFCFGGVSNEKNMRKAFNRARERFRIYRQNGYSRLYIVECIMMETIKYLMA